MDKSVKKTVNWRPDTFNYLMTINAPETAYQPYLHEWTANYELAKQKQEEQYNIKINDKWKTVNKEIMETSKVERYST